MEKTKEVGFQYGDDVEVSNLNHKWLPAKFVVEHPEGGFIVDRNGRPGFEQLEHWQFCRKVEKQPS